MEPCASLLAQYSDLDKHDAMLQDLGGWLILAAVACAVVVIFWYVSKTSRLLAKKDNQKKDHND